MSGKRTTYRASMMGREVVANTASFAEFARLVGQPAASLRRFSSETSNPEAVAVAALQPGVGFFREDHSNEIGRWWTLADHKRFTLPADLLARLEADWVRERAELKAEIRADLLRRAHRFEMTMREMGWVIEALAGSSYETANLRTRLRDRLDELNREIA